MKALCEKYKCYWLLDIIVSYQVQRRVQQQDFQVWKLIVKDSSAVVRCEDGNNNLIVKQKIEYTDFEADEATVYVENSMIYLPSER